jgi:hypothetical protein
MVEHLKTIVQRVIDLAVDLAIDLVILPMILAIQASRGQARHLAG